MLVANWYNNHDIRIEQVTIPQIGPGEVLVKVEASGICGSDVMEWYRLDRAPLVLGHEIGGTIASVGKGVTRYKTGQRITAAHHVPCNTCHFCLSGNHTVCETLRLTNFDPGGFAQFLRLPAINVDRGVFVLPENLSFEQATFIEPLACVLRGQTRAQMKAGKSVIVVGSGIAGLLHIMLAHTLGASRIIAVDINDFRLRAAEKAGASLTLKPGADLPSRLRQVNGGRLADLVIVSTGATSAVIQVLKLVERGGTVLYFAPTGPGITVPLSINDVFWRNDISLTTSYAGSPADYQTAMNIIATNTINVDSLITHRLPMEQIGSGFQLVVEANNSIKVIIYPNENQGGRHAS